MGESSSEVESVRRPGSDGSGVRMAALLLLSLVLHMALFQWAAPYLDRWHDDLFEPPVTIRMLDADADDAAEDPARLPTATPPDPEQVAKEEPKPEEEVEPEPPKVDGQIVEVPTPDIQKIPTDAKFLAESNNAVLQETRTDRFKVNPEVLSNQFSEESKYQTEDTVDVGATNASTGASVGQTSDDSPGHGAPHSLIPSQFSVTNKEGLAAPVPASSRTQELAGAPQNDLLDVARGNQVALNTREFFGAEYMNRIRRQVNLYWSQNIDNLPSSVHLSKSRYDTVVAVVLTGDGVLESIEVTTASGVEPVDNAVVEAFKVAGPFPNPPEQLIARDGRVYLPDFRFDLDVGRASLPYQGIDPRAGVQFPGIMRAPR